MEVSDPLRDLDPEEYLKWRKEQMDRQKPLAEFKRVFVDTDVRSKIAESKQWNLKPYSQKDAAWVTELLNKYPKQERSDVYELENGDVLTNVHHESRCAGRGCAIHHPSNHPLNNAPRAWVAGTIWRECEHSLTQHPDFDAIAFLIDRDGWVVVEHECCAQKCCGIPELVEIHNHD